MRIYIKESSLQAIQESLGERAEKNLLVKKYLDQKFPIRGIAHDGRNTEVAVHSNEDDYSWGYQDIFDDAQKEFKTIYPDRKERDQFLHDAIVAWYYGRMDGNGVILMGKCK